MAEKGVGAREEELRRSVERLQALMEEIPIGVINVDIKGKITYVNKTILQSTGYLREELVGKNAFGLGLFPREMLKVLGGRMKEKLMGEPPSPLEMQFKCKDGEWMWVEISGRALWEHGVPVGIQIVGQDITERKRAEEKIQQQSRFLNIVLDSLGHPFYVIDANDYTIKIANPATKLGKFSENSTCYALTHNRDKPCGGVNVCPLQEVKKTRKPVVLEHIHYDEDGNARNIEVHGYPIFDSEGNVIQMIECNFDITERKRAEEELRETQEQLVRSEKLAAIGQLAGGIGHELRNPLSAIKNAVYYIRRKVANSELAQKEPRVMEFLDIMDDEINASSKTINDLLGFSRVGKPSVSPTPIENVIEDALSHLTIPENIELTEKLDADLPEVEIDAGQVRQVFINVIMNAVEAMPEGGKLAIGAREKDEFLEVEIADTGCGIPQEAVGKIFDPLFTTKARGTGLGLTVCKAIIDRHQGNIEVESQVGKGTTFTVRLPLKAE